MWHVIGAVGRPRHVAIGPDEHGCVDGYRADIPDHPVCTVAARRDDIEFAVVPEGLGCFVSAERKQYRPVEYVHGNPYRPELIADVVDPQRYPLTAQSAGEVFAADSESEFEYELRGILAGIGANSGTDRRDVAVPAARYMRHMRYAVRPWCRVWDSNPHVLSDNGF